MFGIIWDHKEIYICIQHGSIQLIKNYSKDIYNVTKYFIFKSMLFKSKNAIQNIRFILNCMLLLFWLYLNQINAGFQISFQKFFKYFTFSNFLNIIVFILCNQFIHIIYLYKTLMIWKVLVKLFSVLIEIFAKKKALSMLIWMTVC